MQSKKILSIVGLISVMALNSGCTAFGVALGAGAKTGIEAAKEGGIPRAVSDFTIQTKINSLWFQEDVDIYKKLDLTVNQGRVLITGVVQNHSHRVEAVRLAWQPTGVKQVINEIRVSESEGIPGYARDVWITTQLRTKLTLNKNVQSINYSIDTVQGTVYLMGVSQNQDELNRVIDQARMISGVKEVVSYMKFAGQPLTQQTLNSSPAPSVQQYETYNQYTSPHPSKKTGAPENLSPMAQPEPYTENRHIPPPGQWATSQQPPKTHAGSSTYTSSGTSVGSTSIRESVQVYPLND